MPLCDWLNMIKLINHILGIHYPCCTCYLLSCTSFFFSSSSALLLYTGHVQAVMKGLAPVVGGEVRPPHMAQSHVGTRSSKETDR